MSLTSVKNSWLINYTTPINQQRDKQNTQQASNLFSNSHLLSDPNSYAFCNRQIQQVIQKI